LVSSLPGFISFEIVERNDRVQIGQLFLPEGIDETIGDSGRADFTGPCNLDSAKRNPGHVAAKAPPESERRR
jgi:hypothetical protein